ncbi:MAG: hypothetical protein LBP52_10220 [Burkholderiaceae bacterium]|jgi:hypothetical protein|nr:hypothetical protein [Burkholderiaceae bacterium]
MRDSRRRNRNIGTVKQGHGQNNRMCIPDYLSSKHWLHYTERLTDHKKFVHTIQGHEFVFVVEKTRADCYHACSVADVAFMLAHIPASDYGNLRYIVFRQPKRKENILSPVWGRWVLRYEFEGERKPAVLLEAFPNCEQLRWPKSLTPEVRKELERLKKDGLVFVTDKRGYTANLIPETARATQLYRTLLHEVGHYVQYRQFMGASSSEFAGMSDDELDDYFWDSISKEEKEKFAHGYADRLRDDLLARGLIPFPSIPDGR